MAKNDLVKVDNVDYIPERTNSVVRDFLPEMDKKELFNQLQDTAPLEELIGKNFKFLGLLTERVEVPRINEEDAKKKGVEFDPTDTVFRNRLSIITDIGPFHSFSNTFFRAVERAHLVFKDEFKNNTYVISKKSKGVRQQYTIKAI